MTDTMLTQAERIDRVEQNVRALMTEEGFEWFEAIITSVEESFWVYEGETEIFARELRTRVEDPN